MQDSRRKQGLRLQGESRQQHPRTAPAPAELPRSLENARAHGKEELANALIQSVVRDSPSGSGNAGTDDLPCALAIAVDQDNLEPDPDWGGDDDDEEEEMEKRRRQQLGSQIHSLETTGLRPSSIGASRICLSVSQRPSYSSWSGNGPALRWPSLAWAAVAVAVEATLL